MPGSPTAVVPPHAGSGPLTPAQLRIARARLAGKHVAWLAEDLEACPAPVRQAACPALAVAWVLSLPPLLCYTARADPTHSAVVLCGAPRVMLRAYRHLQAGQPQAEGEGPAAGVALIIISDDPSLRRLPPSA